MHALPWLALNLSMCTVSDAVSGTIRAARSASSSTTSARVAIYAAACRTLDLRRSAAAVGTTAPATKLEGRRNGNVVDNRRTRLLLLYVPAAAVWPSLSAGGGDSGAMGTRKSNVTPRSMASARKLMKHSCRNDTAGTSSLCSCKMPDSI